MKVKLIKLILIILLIGSSCSTDLYPSQHFDKGLRVKRTDNSKLRKQIQQYDNCGIFKTQ